jgi:hypothetical protein
MESGRNQRSQQPVGIAALSATAGPGGAAPAQDLAGDPLPDLGEGLAGEAYQVEVAGHDASATPPTPPPRDWALVANEWDSHVAPEHLPFQPSDTESLGLATVLALSAQG